MDPAVALVAAYRRVNGYLTVGEYPVPDVPGYGHAQTVTDLGSAHATLEVIGSELPDSCRRHVAPAG